MNQAQGFAPVALDRVAVLGLSSVMWVGDAVGYLKAKIPLGP